jgi:Na+-transporting NADH:ubiquinone oxidoreductase subunit NqrC
LEDEILDIPLIFAGFVLLGRCLPTTYCTIYYGFKKMKEEQGVLIQQKKIMNVAGIEQMTSR